MRSQTTRYPEYTADGARAMAALLLSVVLLISSSPLFAAEPGGDLDATIQALRTKSGAEYLAARERLLGQSPDLVGPKLEALRQKADDPLEQLVWDALLVRLKDLQDEEQMFAVGRIEDDKVTQARHINVRDKVEFALDEGKYLAGVDRAPAIQKRLDKNAQPIRHPYAGTDVLMRYLKDDALPIAAELILKGIADPWQPWEREALVLTFVQFGWSPMDPKGADAIKDPRAGRVLLWMAEHASCDDPPLPEGAKMQRRTTLDPRGVEPRNTAGLAAYHLSAFPDASLLKEARGALDRAKEEPRRAILTRAIKSIQLNMQKYEARRARRPDRPREQPGP